MIKRIALLALAGALMLSASPPAWTQTLDEAARQVARQYNAQVISAHTVQEGKQRVHVIKILTRDGVVKTVRVPVKGD